METDDVFEQQLQGWTTQVSRTNPTTQWKSGILLAAARSSRRLLPRPLAFAWVAMWLLALLFRLDTPKNDIPPGPALSPVLEVHPSGLFAHLLP
jgi:hypothetical protein